MTIRVAFFHETPQQCVDACRKRVLIQVTLDSRRFMMGKIFKRRLRVTASLPKPVDLCGIKSDFVPRRTIFPIPLGREGI